LEIQQPEANAALSSVIPDDIIQER